MRAQKPVAIRPHPVVPYSPVNLTELGKNDPRLDLNLNGIRLFQEPDAGDFCVEERWVRETTKPIPRFWLHVCHRVKLVTGRAFGPKALGAFTQSVQVLACCPHRESSDENQ